jgi:hypothetical protein
MAGTSGFESILDALGSVLRVRQLLWHYRSRDERLIAFSNAHIYDRSLGGFNRSSQHCLSDRSQGTRRELRRVSSS